MRFDLLDDRLYQDYLRDPRLFGNELRRIPSASWVVVDEVQRLPGLLNEVHRSIEEVGRRFVLLGSSARKLKAAGTNLLAGRALRRYSLFHGFGRVAGRVVSRPACRWAGGGRQ